ncbi:hypothetical protein OIU76_001166 [Salix suchowensis]|nr:hypothetical protein OIU76_001166 [Salix suchowensis]
MAARLLPSGIRGLLLYPHTDLAGIDDFAHLLWKICSLEAYPRSTSVITGDKFIDYINAATFTRIKSASSPHHSPLFPFETFAGIDDMIPMAYEKLNIGIWQVCDTFLDKLYDTE